MKINKFLVVSILAFALLTGGLFTLQTQASTIGVTAKCSPHRVSDDEPIPVELRITLTSLGPYEPEEIDPSTLLVGGVVPMLEAEGWPKIKKKSFRFVIDGEALFYGVVYPIIWHMQPLPQTWVDMDITVTGKFEDTTPFVGTFTFHVRTCMHTHPPLPPP